MLAWIKYFSPFFPMNRQAISSTDADKIWNLSCLVGNAASMNLMSCFNLMRQAILSSDSHWDCVKSVMPWIWRRIGPKQNTMLITRNIATWPTNLYACAATRMLLRSPFRASLRSSGSMSMPQDSRVQCGTIKNMSQTKHIYLQQSLSLVNAPRNDKRWNARSV